MSHNQGSAKNAGRAVLELATLLSDGKWHRTSYLGIAAGKYIRPEIAWRVGRGNISQGQRLFVNIKLDKWERAGRVAKRRNGKFTEWTLTKTEWVIPYLRVLIETLQKQAQNHFEPLTRRSRLVERAERDREILRLRGERLSQTQIAERLGCHQSTVSLVLRAARL